MSAYRLQPAASQLALFRTTGYGRDRALAATVAHETPWSFRARWPPGIYDLRFLMDD